MRLRSPLLARLILLAAFAFCISRSVAPVVYRLQSGDLRIRIAPALPGGDVVLRLGPFGDLSWKVHKAPLAVEAGFVLRPNARDLPRLDALQDLRLNFLLRKLPWLALAGAFAGALVVHGSRRRIVGSAGAGAGALVGLGALLIGISMLTFNARALASPSYRGPIEDAPRVLQILKEVRRDLPGVERNINKVAEGLQRLHSQIVSGRLPPESPSVRFLVISDIHNNPLGLLIAQELVRRFEVDAVLNAGDFTDRGTRPEGELFARFGSLGVDQLVAAGNHEDRAALDRIALIPKLRILEAGRDLSEVGGILVLGEADPNASLVGSDPRNETAEAEIPALCERLRERLASTGARVLLVHDPRMGRCAAEDAERMGRRLVFVWGHLHRQEYEERGTVISLSPGTSGANGLKTPKAAPYGFALLEFEPTTEEVASICLLLFDGPTQLRRTTCHIRPGADRGVGAAEQFQSPQARWPVRGER